jgi:phosphoserine phosphatase
MITTRAAPLATRLGLREVLAFADAVCFDVDSTVTQSEAIDDLAAHSGHGPAVAEWTRKAMGGGVSFREALRQRLEIIKPSRSLVQSLLQENPPRLTPGVKTFISSLKTRGKAVYLVSGGFQEMIFPVAQQLDIPPQNIFANRFLFYDDDNNNNNNNNKNNKNNNNNNNNNNDTQSQSQPTTKKKGDFMGFDESQPTSESGGKRKVVEILKANYGYKHILMIGDGVTDLEAKPPAEWVIGFGGNVVREKVKQEADFFVMSFDELTDQLRLSENSEWHELQESEKEAKNI